MLRNVRWFPGCFVVLSCLVIACKATDPLYCDERTPCAGGKTCNLASRTCEPKLSTEAGGNSDGGSAEAGRDPRPSDGGKLPLGEQCTVGEQCASSHCVDWVCCDGPCAESCQRCDLAPTKGRCAPIPAGTDPDGECQGTDPEHCAGACSGSSSCTFSATDNFPCATQQCTGSSVASFACKTGSCTSTTSPCPLNLACETNGGQCKTSCTQATEAADCAASFFCVHGHCVKDLPLGSDCDGNHAACASKHCTNGVCCKTASCGNATCPGTCMGIAQGANAGVCNFSASDKQACGLFDCPSGTKNYVCSDGACVNIGCM